MRHVHALLIGGALFKKKIKEPGPHGEENRAREKAIREKVVDDLRDREDALRDHRTELAAKEEELSTRSAELAQKLQELAAREGELRAKYGEGPVPPAPAAPPGNALPPDADTIEEQENLVAALEKRLGSARRRHEDLRKTRGAGSRLADTIAAYKASGYVVARLESLKAAGPEDILKTLAQYEKDAASLQSLAARCDAIDRSFAKDANAIRARCNDPDAVSGISRALDELEARVSARCNELRKRIGAWKAEGYSVARFSSLEEGGVGALEEGAIKFEEDIEVLRMFSEKLEGLDPSLQKDAARLKPLLKDPDRLPQLERELLALERQAGMQKQEFLGLHEGWKAEGYRTDALDKALAADGATLRAAFLKFDEDVRRLRALSERAARLDSSFSSQVASLHRDLKDPAQITSLEGFIKKLEEEQERRKAAAAPARPPAPRPFPIGKAADRAAPAQAAPNPAGAKTAPAAPAAAAPEAPAGPGSSGPESEVLAHIQLSENLIHELESRKIDPTAASNLLKLAKSFNRSRNFAKALQYARKAGETAAALKK